jgi:glycine betaine/proline transport system ATP-binding protein
VTDTSLLTAINAGRRDLATAVTRDYHVVEPDAIIGDVMHLAGRQVVPITVVDAQGRLAGVVPRAAILSTLSTAREVSHA